MSDGDGNKRIQFQESTPVLRSNSLEIAGADGSTKDVLLEPKKKDFDTSSLESLYEKLPAILPVTNSNRSRVRPANSLPHIYSVIFYEIILKI